jgi:hypothetical protein
MGIDNSTWILIGIIAAVIALRHLGAAQRGARRCYCPRCGTVAAPQSRARGSRGIELLLWLCFIIPGLIYSFWRRAEVETCPACGEAGLIPASSPRAQAELKAREVV